LRVRLEQLLAPELVDALIDLVGEERERRQKERGHDHDHDGDPQPFLTVARYAKLHHATPAAVRARVRRGQLGAIRPPGRREYLIPTATIPGHVRAPATLRRPGA
jgi:hypothetical protein